MNTAILLSGGTGSRVHLNIPSNQLNVMGVWNSRFDHSADDDWHYVIERLKGHMIDPAGLITHRYPLHKLTDGLGVMKDKTEDYCKIMCVGNPAYMAMFLANEMKVPVLEQI